MSDLKERMNKLSAITDIESFDSSVVDEEGFLDWFKKKKPEVENPVDMDKDGKGDKADSLLPTSIFGLFKSKPKKRYVYSSDLAKPYVWDYTFVNVGSHISILNNIWQTIESFYKYRLSQEDFDNRRNMVETTFIKHLENTSKVGLRKVDRREISKDMINSEYLDNPSQWFADLISTVEYYKKEMGYFLDYVNSAKWKDQRRDELTPKSVADWRKTMDTLSTLLIKILKEIDNSTMTKMIEE